jgi:hypothetical protein
MINAKKIVTAAATASLMFGVFAPAALADSTLTITGNGSQSHNTADVTTTNSNVVTQSNDAHITNNVSTTSDTGGNKANDNTGGDVSVRTGDSLSKVSIDNKANLNFADLGNCNCATNTDVTIAGNGSKSVNKADVDTSNANQVFQDNRAYFDNNVRVNGNTGDNNASGNTGGVLGSSVSVRTGDAMSEVGVSNAANANVATIGSGAGSNGGTLSARILDNGSRSRNTIDLDQSNLNTVVQDNHANFDNDVTVRTKTGDNKANDNTGGDTSIRTGDSLSKVMVQNKANFNWADLDCGCLLDTTAKIAGNGSESHNRINADLTDGSSIFQGGREGAGNDAWFDNSVHSYGDTGYNRANDNTSGVYDPADPRVSTGDSLSQTGVYNSANVNVVGNSPFLGGMDFSFDLGGMMNSLGL